MPTTPRKTNAPAAKRADTMGHATAIMVIKSNPVSTTAKSAAAKKSVAAKPGRRRPRNSPQPTEPGGDSS